MVATPPQAQLPAAANNARHPAVWLGGLLAGLLLVVGGSLWWLNSNDGQPLASQMAQQGASTLQLLSSPGQRPDAQLLADARQLLARVQLLERWASAVEPDRQADYYQLLCQQAGSHTGWLMFHHSQLEQLADEQLRQCLN